MPKQPQRLPPLATLRREFLLDIQTGALFAKISRTSRKVGDRVDFIDKKCGYFRIWLGRNRYLAHRIVWKLAYKVDPISWIDHINGNRLDNRPENLRECSHPQNMYNRPAPPHNTSGAKGVHHRKDNGKWRAFISVDRKRISLGQFPSLKQAIQTVQKARKELHGKFAKD